VLRAVDDYNWRLEDTTDFVAGRIVAAEARYHEQLYPPMFRALVDFAESYPYSWHTPGHTGGAFLRTAAGRAFFDFFGERLFRTDLSISVQQLGSLLDHSGPIGAAERYAATVFGADDAAPPARRRRRARAGQPVVGRVRPRAGPARPAPAASV
jgi:arginine decarboxylase